MYVYKPLSYSASRSTSKDPTKTKGEVTTSLI